MIRTAVGFVAAIAVMGATGCSNAPRESERAILRLLWPTLHSDGAAGRLYYRASACPEEAPPVFRALSIWRPPRGMTGVAAVQYMFSPEKNVSISKDRSGVVRINVGKVPRYVLDTPVGYLPLNPRAQANAFSAIYAILGAREVRERMKVLGASLPAIKVGLLQAPWPMEGRPHLPPALTNVTVDRALDVVAKTFDVIVTYGACDHPRRFLVEDYDPPPSDRVISQR